MHWWCRNKKFKATPIELMRRRKNEIKIFEIEHDYKIEITKFSEMLTKSLEDNLRKKLASRRNHSNTRLSFGEAELEMILGVDGCTTHHTTTKQREVERRVGTAINQHFYV